MKDLLITLLETNVFARTVLVGLVAGFIIVASAGAMGTRSDNVAEAAGKGGGKPGGDSSGPVLVAPINDEVVGGTLTFSWSNVRLARGYDIQVTNASDVSFMTPVIDDTTSKTSYTPQEPLGQGAYIWKVRRTGSNSYPWSDISSFIVMNAVTNGFTDNFESYTANDCLADNSTFGPWNVVFGGYGCVRIEDVSGNNVLHQNPRVSSSSAMTSASLVVGPLFSAPYTYAVTVRTEEQQRVNNPANAWEVAWILWNYTDNEHFYYFVPKPNGWELGKADPAYPGNQRFLATGGLPVYPIGSDYAVTVEQVSVDTVRVFVNGQLVTEFTDTERPYASGKIGLYNEDAHVHFDDVSVTW